MRYGKEFQTDWYVSHYDLDESVLKSLKLPGRVFFHDVTLREGDQHAGTMLSKKDKIRIAEKLAKAGVPRIEPCMPIVSQEDREALRAIANEKWGAEIWAACRSVNMDIDYAIEAGADGIAVIILANDQYLKSYNWTLERTIEMASKASSYAHSQGKKTTLLVADSSRMETSRFLKIAKEVHSQGHIDSITMMDTFGLFTPHGFQNFWNKVHQELPVPLDVHFHNDFGLATANSLTAVTLGVEVIHTSVNGIGERIGNTPLEEISMVLELLYNVPTGIRKEKLYELSRLIEELTGIPVPDTKPVVGLGLKRIESGLVAAEYLRLIKEDKDWGRWLVPFLPHVIGMAEDLDIVLGKASGMANLDWKLQQLGVTLEEDRKKKLLTSIKDVAMKKKRLVTDQEVKDLIEQL